LIRYVSLYGKELKQKPKIKRNQKDTFFRSFVSRRKKNFPPFLREYEIDATMLRSIFIIAVLLGLGLSSAFTTSLTRPKTKTTTALGIKTWFRQNLENDMAQRAVISEAAPKVEEKDDDDEKEELFFRQVDASEIEKAMKPLQDAIAVMEEEEATTTIKEPANKEPIVMGSWFRRNMVMSQPMVVGSVKKESVVQKEDMVDVESVQRALLTAQLEITAKSRALAAAKEAAVKEEALHRSLLSAQFEMTAISRALAVAQEASRKEEEIHRSLLSAQLEMTARANSLAAAKEASMKAELAQRALLSAHLEIDSKMKAMTGTVAVSKRGMIQKWNDVEEEKRAAKYGSIESKEERAYTILKDLNLLGV